MSSLIKNGTTPVTAALQPQTKFLEVCYASLVPVKKTTTTTNQNTRSGFKQPLQKCQCKKENILSGLRFIKTSLLVLVSSLAQQFASQVKPPFSCEFVILPSAHLEPPCPPVTLLAVNTQIYPAHILLILGTTHHTYIIMHVYYGNISAFNAAVLQSSQE